MKKLLTILALFVAVPASAQELTPLQQYLYNESGYAPPQLARPAPAPSPYATAYVPAPVQPRVYYTPAPAPSQDAAPEGYYEEVDSAVGPSSESSNLRGLLTSSGF